MSEKNIEINEEPEYAEGKKVRNKCRQMLVKYY